MADLVEIIQNYTVGGDILDNEWVYEYKDVLSNFVWEDLTVSKLDFSISDYLPEEGDAYEILGWIDFMSSTIKGDQPIIGIGNSNDEFYNKYSPSVNTTAASYRGGGTFRIIIDSNSDKDTVRLYNIRGEEVNNLYVRFIAYRKMGTNT